GRVLYEGEASRAAAAPAETFGGRTRTYAELNARANRLSRHLVEQGAGPEQRVALMLPRSAELVVAVLAVLKSGAAYVPIDPDYPDDRVAYLLEVATSDLVLGPEAVDDTDTETDTDTATATGPVSYTHLRAHETHS
ncbi:AMP-binding protein, partial [Actinomadura sp. BRA 177]|uniref:AMP-binding protein n=1 Tax=Actinomadura sp. BRA 177 TaxID=2745202 RepID=UPI001595C785